MSFSFFSGKNLVISRSSRLIAMKSKRDDVFTCFLIFVNE